MNNEEKDRIKEYIVIFKNLIAPYLKPTVAVASYVYPYSNGVVIMFQFNFQALTETRFEPECHSLKEVVDKYGLDVKGISIDNLHNQHPIIFSGQNVLSVKGYESREWSSERANSLVETIIESIRKRDANKN